jgi:hypothetical protein
MPLTPKGAKIKKAMEKEYGKKKGESVFFASANKGTITNVHEATERFCKNLIEREKKKK